MFPYGKFKIIEKENWVMKYVFRRFGKLIFPSKYQIIDVYSSNNFTIKKYQTLITMDNHRAFSTSLVFPSWQKNSIYGDEDCAIWGTKASTAAPEMCQWEGGEGPAKLLWDWTEMTPLMAGRKKWLRKKRCRRLDSNASRKSEKEKEKERERERDEILGKEKKFPKEHEDLCEMSPCPTEKSKTAPRHDSRAVRNDHIVSVCVGSIVMFSRTLPFSSFLQ